ncbi:hypothetical protein GCM10022275_16090 [Tessaracoccus defluvii]
MVVKAHGYSDLASKSSITVGSAVAMPIDWNAMLKTDSMIPTISVLPPTAPTATPLPTVVAGRVPPPSGVDSAHE